MNMYIANNFFSRDSVIRTDNRDEQSANNSSYYLEFPNI